MQSDPIDVHNDYLHLLCEYGAIGAAGFLLFLYAHLRHGLQSFIQFGPRRAARGASPLSNRLALNIGALCAVAAYIVHSTVDFNLHIPANALLLAFVFGLIANPDIKQTSETLHPDGNFLPRIAVALLSEQFYWFKASGCFQGEANTRVLLCGMRTVGGDFLAQQRCVTKTKSGYFFYLDALPARSPITASRVKTAHRFTVRQWQPSKGQ
jgi:O-antigen ligase